ALALPLTRSPPVRTITLPILPPTALTMIPRFGAVSVPPPTGVIDNCTPSAAPPILVWPPARVGPPEQPAATKPRVAQIAPVATACPRSRNDRKEVAFEIAAGRNFGPPDFSQQLTRA